MPRGFKLPSETIKFDGRQEPKTWLEDHRESVKMHKGSTVTAMQCLQLQLVGNARLWLQKQPRGSIRSWEELVDKFVKNFRATSKRPASIDELRACNQRSNESVRSFLHRWTSIKHATEDISDERAIDAFCGSVRRRELKEELGRKQPKTIDHLMDIVNQWADGEDSL